MAPLLEQNSDREWHGRLNLITGPEAEGFWAGDGQVPLASVWVGAFNCLNVGALLADLAKLEWRSPLGVQVLIRAEEDDCWGLWMIVGDRFEEVAFPGAFRGRSAARFAGAHGQIEEPGMLMRRTRGNGA